MSPPNPRRHLVRDELLTRAAEVFERQGFAQTRIQDIAEALGLSRSALYHYFTSKDDILAALIAEHTERRAAAMVALVSDTSRPVAERLRAALRATIAERLTGGPRLRVLDQLAIEMPPNLRTTFDRARRQVLNLYTGLIAEGVENGEFRPVDARVAALAVLGIAAWTSWWYSPDGRKSPEELADLLADIGLNGLLSRAGEQPPATDRDGLMRQIRERLDLLDRL